MIIGFLGRGRVKRGEANNGGVAIAGIVLGALAIVSAWRLIRHIWAYGLEGRRRRRLHRLHAESRLRPVEQQQCEQQFRQHVEDRFSVTLTPTPVP